MAGMQDSMGRDKQLQLLLEYADLIKLGLAGNLRSYEIQDARGNSKKGLQLRYGVQPAGYASEPWETVNYTCCHDGEILFDQVCRIMCLPSAACIGGGRSSSELAEASVGYTCLRTIFSKAQMRRCLAPHHSLSSMSSIVHPDGAVCQTHSMAPDSANAYAVPALGLCISMLCPMQSMAEFECGAALPTDDAQIGGGGVAG